MKKLMLVILVVSLLLAPLLMRRVRIERVNAFPSTDIFADSTDGYLDSNNIVYSTFSQMSLGDWSNNAYSHCYVKFSLSGVSGTLSSATLNLYVYRSYHDNNSYSASPLANPGLGNCEVTHIADYGTIDSSDFSAASIGNDPGVLLSGSATPNVGYVSIDVRAAMQDDMNHGRAWSTFMLGMSTTTDGNSDNDYWVFYTSRDASSAHHPYVTYDLVPVYQGDLVLDGNNVTVIEGQFDINGSIYVEDNATLILRNAIINFTEYGSGILMRYPANGNPRLQAENSEIVGDTDNRFYDNSSATFSHVTGSVYFYFYGETSGSFVDSTIDGFNARESSTVIASNSTLQYLTITVCGGNVSVVNLSPGFFDYWDFQENCSVVSTPQDEVPEVVLSQTTVNAWSFSFQNNSTATITKCELSHLHTNIDTTMYPTARVDAYDSIIDTVELYTSVTVTLTNTTHTSLQPHDSTRVYVYWFLDVQVLDDSPAPGQSVQSANVTATFPNGTLAEQALTGFDGWIRLTLMEKMRNVTGTYPVGNYTVEAAYVTYSNGTTVNMTGNKQTILTLDGLVIPEFPSFLILASFMTAALLTVAVCKRKKWKLKLPA
jgi:hypothetical protein